MPRQRIFRLILGISLVVNLAGASGMLYALHAKGGFAYVRQKLNPIDPFRARRESLFAVLDKTANKPVVFLGDSLTANGEWSELLQAPVLNRGISGDTTTGLLARLDRITALHPRAVFLMIGVNDRKDLHLPTETTLTNYREILRRMREKSPETVIYVESILPTSGLDSNFNASSLAVNRGLREMCDGSQVVYLDLYDQFLRGGELNPDFSVDGVHLSGMGYEVWKNNIAPHIARITAAH